jgi:hypothetical protein
MGLLVASGSGLKTQEVVSITKHPALEVKSLYGAQQAEAGKVLLPPTTVT